MLYDALSTTEITDKIAEAALTYFKHYIYIYIYTYTHTHTQPTLTLQHNIHHLLQWGTINTTYINNTAQYILST